MEDTKYEIFIGLNQKDTGENFDVQYVENILNKEFTDYKINFSLNRQLGGYVHKDGTYVIEDGLKMTFIGKRTTIEENSFFNRLKKAFKQESVLVIKRSVKAEFRD